DAAAKVAEAARLAALEKARKDSIAKAEADAREQEKLRLAALEKARQDSIAQAKVLADKKAKEEAAERARLAALEKIRQDSLTKAQALADAEAKRKAQEEADAQRLREIEAQKQALARLNEQKDKKQNTASLPVFEDKDYAEGLTEETIDESNRKIYRTIIKKSNTTDVFSKVVYNWGGVYFFKNTTSMSESNYNNELKKYKDQLGK
ncbi:MAG: hypothetical protein IT212_07360, partial [Bacteroidia bacterium]|nr:hypothetical protein [Bacteroidia bacterium]